MISLRFFNFRSRGYGASDVCVEHNVRWILTKTEAEIAGTVRCFLKRKVCKAKAGNVDAVSGSDKRLKIFKTQLVKDFELVKAKTGICGEAWFASHVQPIADELRAELL